MESKYTEILNNEEFVTKINEAKDKAEAAAILNAYGIPATEEALEKAEKEMVLDENDLDNVSGGIVKFLIKINPLYWLTKWYVEKALGKNGMC